MLEKHQTFLKVFVLIATMVAPTSSSASAVGTILPQLGELLQSGSNVVAGNPKADELVALAERQAAKSHRLIFIKFGASWCAPCRIWNIVLADRTIKPIMQKYFVVLDLDSIEWKDDLQVLEKPGAPQLMYSLGAKGLSLPFLAIVSSSGKQLFSSNRPVSGTDDVNIGYPSTTGDLNWFMEQLHMVVPILTRAESDAIRLALISHAPKS